MVNFGPLRWNAWPARGVRAYNGGLEALLPAGSGAEPWSGESGGKAS